MPTITGGPEVYTFEDAVARLLGYCNSNGQANAVDAVNQAVIDMYEEIALGRDWTYLNRTYRLTIEPSETGTCTYDASTGEFTIDSGAWPSWAERAFIEIGTVRHLVKTRTSDTVLVADDVLRPSDDIATGTQFTILLAIYQLPRDFRRLWRPLDETDDTWGRAVDFATWAELMRYATGAASPWAFAVAADPYEPVRQVLLIDPYGDTERTTDLPYQRWPRTLAYNGKESHCNAGTITASGTAVTGSGTSFEAGMVGALLRISRTPTTTRPGARGATDGYKQQTYIAGYSSATSITLHESLTVTGGKYSISDPLDLDRTMLQAFWLGCEWKLSESQGFDNVEQKERSYLAALAKAKGGDQKTNTRRTAWQRRGTASRAFGHNTIINTDPDPDD